MKNEKILSLAKEAMQQSYCPYSNFNVGAAVLCEDGEIFTGCNVENSSFPLCICAERTAFAKAVSEGKRKFEAIAIVGGKDGKIGSFCYPCGACRQVMSEFCDDDFELIFENEKGQREVNKLSEILPKRFKLGE